MASYKRNAESNRDALFGGSSASVKGAAGGSKKSGNRNTPASKRPAGGGGFQAVATNSSSNNDSMGMHSSVGTRRKNDITTGLSGAAKVDKMKEAEDYRNKAKNAMTKKLFSPIDPIAGAMFYHRAAEAYKLCGENRLERLHRIASGDCQLGHGAFSTAAQEYVRAAELSEISDETKGRIRAECSKLYQDAASAYKESGDMGRSGECMLKSAFSLLIGNGEDDEEEEDDMNINIVIGGKRLMSMNKDALKAIEVAIESFVPDPLNRYKEFRQSGISAFVDPEASEQTEDEIDEETLMELCRGHIITTSYTNETLFLAVRKFVEYGEYKSALYAAGAVTAVLEHEGFATISLSRAFCVETILALAIGDVVTADKFFLQSHLQNNSYLTSRECKLSEDLIRAVKMRDVNDLEDARHPSGGNKAALSNLDSSIRALVAGLRISGAAKKKVAPVPNPPLVTAPPLSSSYNTVEAPVVDEKSHNNVHDELDDLMNGMGLGDDDDDDDDDLDLR